MLDIFRKKRKGSRFCVSKNSPYSDAEESSHLRSCLRDAIINAAPRIGGIDKLELYRQCPPRRVKDIHITELKKCECVSSIMTIAPVLNIDRLKMGYMGILLVIDYVVYV